MCGSMLSTIRAERAENRELRELLATCLGLLAIMKAEKVWRPRTTEDLDSAIDQIKSKFGPEDNG